MNDARRSDPDPSPRALLGARAKGVLAAAAAAVLALFVVATRSPAPRDAAQASERGAVLEQIRRVAAPRQSADPTALCRRRIGRLKRSLAETVRRLADARTDRAALADLFRRQAQLAASLEQAHGDLAELENPRARPLARP